VYSNAIIIYFLKVAYLLSVYPSEQDLEEDFIRTISFSGFALVKHNLGELVNMSNNNLTVNVIQNESSLFEICKLFAKGIHRIPILDQNKVVAIISQSTVISFIHQKTSKFPAIASKILKELGIYNKQVVSIPPETVTVKALHLLLEKKFSAVVVVKQKEPIANFSVSDIRSLDSNNFVDLTLKVQDYLQDRGKFNPPISLSPTATIKDLLELLTKNALHRVWIVDNNEVQGLTTLTDVIKYLMIQFQQQK